MSGFQHAPVTKGTMMLLGIDSLAVSLLDIKPYCHLQLVPHLTKYHQFWRILVHPFVFANSTELVLGLLLLYTAGRQIERSFGPRKFSAFVVLSYILSTLLSLSAIIVFNRLGLNAIPAGPYGLIFSLLWQYHRTVPSLYTFRLFGFDLGSKFFVWVLSAWLLTINPPASVVAGTSGLITGYLYRTDTLLLPSIRRGRFYRPLKSFRIPGSIYNLLGRLFDPLIGVSLPPRRTNRVLPGQINETTLQEVATRATLTSMLAGQITANAAARRANAVARRAANARQGAVDTATPTPPANQQPIAPTGRADAARAAVGDWMNEMTGGSGSGARAPTAIEIATLSSMFPHLSRQTVVTALQRNNYNTAQAVEALLQEGS